MATILSSRQTFFTGSDTGSWIYKKDSHEYFRNLELLIDALAQILTEIYHFQNLTFIWPGDVIDDVMSAWNITCTTRHPQQCTCKILFVWHQSFIVKSSGQTSWYWHKVTNKQTNKHTGWKHYHLANAINNKTRGGLDPLSKYLRFLSLWPCSPSWRMTGANRAWWAIIGWTSKER